MDPLLARKNPVAGGCKYDYQVFIAELSLLLQTLYGSPAGQEGSCGWGMQVSPLGIFSELSL
jgi:hypothetical protein